MNLTYKLFGCSVIRFTKFIIWLMKYLTCTFCNMVNLFIERVNCIIDSFCTNGTRKICKCFTFFIFFCSKRTKNRLISFLSEIVTCWGRVIVKILETFEKVVCEVIPLCGFHILDYFVAIFVLAVTWGCKTVDWFVTWVLCLTYLGDGMNCISKLFCDDKRVVSLAPVVVTDKDGYSKHFIYIQETGDYISTTTTTQHYPDSVKPDNVYILGCNGEMLKPFRVDISGLCGTGKKLSCDDSYDAEYIYKYETIECGVCKWVPAVPFMYRPEKIIEMTDRLLSGKFANTNTTKYSYCHDILEILSTLDNNYDNYLYGDLPHSVDTTGMKTPGDTETLADVVKNGGKRLYTDYGIRIYDQDTDNYTTDVSTNTHVGLKGGYKFVSNDKLTNTKSAQTLNINDYKFLMKHNDDDCNTLTIFFVNEHDQKSGDVSCTDLLGYICCPAVSSGEYLVVQKGSETDRNGTNDFPFYYDCDINSDTTKTALMNDILEKFKSKKQVVNCAEELIRKAMLQCGISRTTEIVENCDMTRDGISRVMSKVDKPGDASDPNPQIIRRIITLSEWCMFRDSGYLVRDFCRAKDFYAAELPNPKTCHLEQCKPCNQCR